jgi:hypothetical protein
MKKLKFITLALVVAATMTACKKEYPDDIPDWLKQKIEKMKKKYDDICAPRGISEYFFNSNTIYRLISCEKIIYDYNGTVICKTMGGSFEPYDCECMTDFEIFIENPEKYFVRVIWVEKEKVKYK